MEDYILSNDGQKNFVQAYSYSKQEVLGCFPLDDGYGNKTSKFGNVEIHYLTEEDKFFISINGFKPKEISMLRVAKLILPPKNQGGKRNGK